MRSLTPARASERPSLIMGDVGADQSADAGGVDVENPGEIHDEGGGVFGADRGLELEQGCEHDRALKVEDSLAGAGTFEIVRYAAAPGTVAASGDFTGRGGAELLQGG